MEQQQELIPRDKNWENYPFIQNQTVKASFHAVTI